jgi:hypothetical protein
MITVTDDFLLPYEFQKLQSMLMSEDLPWFWQNTVTKQDEEKYQYGFQLTHVLYKDDAPQSGANQYLEELYNVLGVRTLIRSKVNLGPMAGQIVKHMWHNDFDYDDSKTAILYLNTCNGYTEFKKSGKKVNSVENRLVKFTSNILHAGTTCTDSDRRMSININYF